MGHKMKKISTILVATLFFTLSSSAEGFRVGGSMGYYSVADSIYKNTYGSGHLMYGVSLSYGLMRNLSSEERSVISEIKGR